MRSCSGGEGRTRGSAKMFLWAYSWGASGERLSMTLYAIAVHAIVSRINSFGLVEAAFAARLGRVFTRRGNETDSIRGEGAGKAGRSARRQNAVGCFGVWRGL